MAAKAGSIMDILSARGPELAPTARRVLEAAVMEISQRGYLGATTARIARRAGVTEATLFKHFPSKARFLEEIPALVLERMLKPLLISSLARFREAEAGSSLCEILEAIFKDRLGLLIGQADLLKASIDLIMHQEGEARDRLLSSLEETLDYADEFHARQIRDGRYRLTDEKLASRTMLALILGAAMVSVLMPGADSASATKTLPRYLADIFLHGIAVESGA
jgi:AcrR family transcriptional regulator